MEYVLKNFLDQEDINAIINLAQVEFNNNHINYYPETGRAIVSIENGMKRFYPNIIEKIENIASKEYKTDLKIKRAGYMKYSKEYGIPALHPHIDAYVGQVVFDYQVRSNIDWAVVVEGRSYTLKDNDALMFSGEDQAHWREILNFNDDNYLDILVFNLADSKHWSNFNDENPRPIDEIMEDIFKIREKYKDTYPLDSNPLL